MENLLTTNDRFLFNYFLFIIITIFNILKYTEINNDILKF